MAASHLSTVWTIVLFSAGCVTLSTNGEPDQVPPTASVEEASEATPISAGGDPAQLRSDQVSVEVQLVTPISAGGDPAQLLRCQTACNQGGQSLKNFCATVPHPAMRATCYGFLVVGEVACLGWCYNYWGY